MGGNFIYNTKKAKGISIIFLLGLMLAIGIVQVNASPVWKYHADNNNSGVYDDGGIHPGNGSVWNFVTGARVTSAPTLVDGTIYAGCDDSYVYAIYANNGTQKWRFKTGYYVMSTPAVVNGIVYVGGEDGYVYAINANTGSEIWRFSAASRIDSSPAVSDGIVYIGCFDGNVYALDATTGAKAWNFTAGGVVYSSPAVTNGVVYVGGSRDGNVYALDATTGAVEWTCDLGDNIGGSPAIANGVVYIAGDNHQVNAIDANTGSPLWSFTTGNVVGSTPAIANGIVYEAGSYDGYLYALDAATGAQIWKYYIGSDLGSASVANGIVYICCQGGYVEAFDAMTGSQLWTYKTPDGVEVWGPPPTIANGMVYFSSDNGVRAIGSAPRLSVMPNYTMTVIGSSKSFDLVLDPAYGGLSGYDLCVSLDNPSAANVTAISWPSWAAQLHKNTTVSPGTMRLSAVDLGNQVQAGTGSVVLATITVHANQKGNTTININSATLDDDFGNPVVPVTEDGNLSVRQVEAFPGSAKLPTDPDGDGLYEDINGNGRMDFNDIVLFYNNMDWVRGNLNVGIDAYDFNRNGLIDFDDVVMLYDEMLEAL